MRREVAPEHLSLPGWGSLLPLLLQAGLERRLLPSHKTHYCPLAKGVPPASLGSFPFPFLPAAGCMKLPGLGTASTGLASRQLSTELAQWEHRQEIRGKRPVR